MRNATTLRMFAVLIGFVLALPAAAEEQNSSTLKTEPVSTDKAASSCSSAASTLVDPTSPAFDGISGGFSTADAHPLASFLGTAVGSSSGPLCVAGESRCLGREVGTHCGGHKLCLGAGVTTGGYTCNCLEVDGGNNPPHCHPRRNC